MPPPCLAVTPFYPVARYLPRAGSVAGSPSSFTLRLVEFPSSRLVVHVPPVTDLAVDVPVPSCSLVGSLRFRLVPVYGLVARPCWFALPVAVGCGSFVLR